MSYEKTAALAAMAYRRKAAPLMLAIESSCDETAAAVVSRRRVLGMSVHTQIPLHKEYGGVVPELASRSHVEKVGPVTAAALKDAGVSLRDIDAVAVTCGPGLVGALLVGVSYAKGLAYSLGLPLVGVDHIVGHIAANYITYPELEPPFVCLIASGGHSELVRVNGYSDFTYIGGTRDDAAGEAFDKSARALGLGYPGGPELEALAKDGDPHAFTFSSPFNSSDSMDFSFSGIKTAVVNLLHNAEQKGETLNRADIAASFQQAVTDTLMRRSIAAVKQSGLNRLALAGGVSANSALRGALQAAADANGFTFFRPEMRFCTDNAAMIACAGHYALTEGRASGLTLNADPALNIV